MTSDSPRRLRRAKSVSESFQSCHVITSSCNPADSPVVFCSFHTSILCTQPRYNNEALESVGRLMKRAASPTQSGREEQRIRRQDPVSCSLCRSKKLRCSREAPCSNCRSRCVECDFGQTTRANNGSAGGGSKRGSDERCVVHDSVLMRSLGLSAALEVLGVLYTCLSGVDCLDTVSYTSVLRKRFRIKPRRCVICADKIVGHRVTTYSLMSWLGFNASSVLSWTMVLLVV